MINLRLIREINSEESELKRDPSHYNQNNRIIDWQKKKKEKNLFPFYPRCRKADKDKGRRNWSVRVNDFTIRQKRDRIRVVRTLFFYPGRRGTATWKRIQHGIQATRRTISSASPGCDKVRTNDRSVRNGTENSNGGKISPLSKFVSTTPGGREKEKEVWGGRSVIRDYPSK